MPPSCMVPLLPAMLIAQSCATQWPLCHTHRHNHRSIGQAVACRAAAGPAHAGLRARHPVRPRLTSLCGRPPDHQQAGACRVVPLMRHRVARSCWAGAVQCSTSCTRLRGSCWQWHPAGCRIHSSARLLLSNATYLPPLQSLSVDEMLCILGLDICAETRVRPALSFTEVIMCTPLPPPTPAPAWGSVPAMPAQAAAAPTLPLILALAPSPPAGRPQVGVAMLRGISGGQMKRLTAGEVMVRTRRCCTCGQLRGQPQPPCRCSLCHNGHLPDDMPPSSCPRRALPLITLLRA